MGRARAAHKGGILVIVALLWALRDGLTGFTANYFRSPQSPPSLSLSAAAPPADARRLSGVSLRAEAEAGTAQEVVAVDAQANESVAAVPAPRLPIPTSTEVMCKQAADAVMRAYRDGWTRQTIRLRTDAVFDSQELYSKGTGSLLKSALPLFKSFTAKLWNGESLKRVKTSAIDTDVGTLLYREAENAMQDSAVLALASRDTVTEAGVMNFYKGMGDRLVVMANTEQAPSGWSVEKKGRDFYLVSNADLGAEVANTFQQQAYYISQGPLNNWQVMFFRAYPHPWEIYIENLDLEMVKLGEYEEKPPYDVIIAAMEDYEAKNKIQAYKKVGKILKDNQQAPNVVANPGGEDEGKDGVAVFFDALKGLF